MKKIRQEKVFVCGGATLSANDGGGRDRQQAVVASLHRRRVPS